MLPYPAKAQAHVAGEHSHESARARVDGWRHMGGAHTPVEGVAAALMSGLDSCDSPSALSVSRAPSTDQAALEEPLRCSELYASKAPAVACSEVRPRPIIRQPGGRSG